MMILRNRFSDGNTIIIASNKTIKMSERKRNIKQKINFRQFDMLNYSFIAKSFGCFLNVLTVFSKITCELGRYLLIIELI